MKTESGNSTEIRELTAKINSISQTGQVKISFSEDVIGQVNDGLLEVDKALKVTAMAFDSFLDYSIPVEIESKCIKLKDKEMELQLTF